MRSIDMPMQRSILSSQIKLFQLGWGVMSDDFETAHCQERLDGSVFQPKGQGCCKSLENATLLGYDLDRENPHHTEEGHHEVYTRVL
jgi:hypothetical protein